MATIVPQKADEATTETYLDDDFGQYVQSLLDEYHIPGIGIAVVYDGKVESSGYGLARLPDVRATADTVFCMGSTTKAFTAALLGLLIEDAAKEAEKSTDDDVEPTLTWSTRVKTILGDDLETMDPYIADNMTIEDMLSHRTGIPGHDLVWGPWLKDPATVTRLLRYNQANEPFRTRLQYNNVMYGALGYAIDIITGQDYASVINQRIFEPLKMSNTYMGAERASEVLASSKNDDLEFARGYKWVEEEGKDGDKDTAKKSKSGYYVAVPHTSILPLEAAGAILSSVNDYAKWVLELLRASAEPLKDNEDGNKSKDDKPKPVISNSLWNEMTTPRSHWLPVPVFNPASMQTTPNMQVNAFSYSLGWLNDPFLWPGETIVQHGGGVPGFGSLVYMAPNRNFGVVTVANTADKAGQVNEFVTKDLLGRRIGKTKEERRKRYDDDKTKSLPESKESPKYHATDAKFAQETLKLLNNPMKTDNSDTQSESASSFLLAGEKVSLPKTFKNPAYGSFTVTLAPATMALSHAKPVNVTSSIIRSNLKLEKTTPPENDEQPHTISIRPVGPRGINYELILHPSAVKDDKIIYDSEQIARSGLPDTKSGDHPDPFASLPPGHGNEGDEKYPYRDVKVWTSESLKINGGVLLLDKNPDGDGLAVVKMGLRLARIMEAKNLKNGVLERGWDSRLEWFEP